MFDNVFRINSRCKRLRKDIYLLSKANGGYHYGGSFSCVEILVALYDYATTSLDRIILSKGHGCWGVYVIQRERKKNPLLEGHPYMDRANGIEWTTGSMGHGLPAAVGMALARKLLGTPGKIFVVMGDGECQEGTTWESILLAVKLQLGNLVVIVDNNQIQGSGRTDDVLAVIKPLSQAAYHAGWRVDDLDGHDVSALSESLKVSWTIPYLIIANTIKGKGVSFMEKDPKWHANWVDEEHEKQLLKELSV